MKNWVEHLKGDRWGTDQVLQAGRCLTGGSNVVTERHTFRHDLGGGHREHVLEIGRRFESREPETAYTRKEIHVITAAQYTQ